MLDYQVSYAVNGEAYTIFASNIIEQTEIVTGLTPGVTYSFLVQARNIVGLSANSAAVVELAAQVPDQPTQLQDVPEVTLDT